MGIDGGIGGPKGLGEEGEVVRRRLTGHSVGGVMGPYLVSW